MGRCPGARMAGGGGGGGKWRASLRPSPCKDSNDSSVAGKFPVRVILMLGGLLRILALPGWVAGSYFASRPSLGVLG